MHQNLPIIEYLSNIFNVFSTLNVLGWISAIGEILILALVIYKILKWIQSSRAWSLLRGIIVIGLFVLVSWILDFAVILWIIRSLGSLAILAIVVVFQEDIRRGLEHLGRRNFFLKFFSNLNKFTKINNESVVEEIVEATFAMSKVKTGALIVIENSESLEEVEKTGITINGIVTKQLLINIFEKNTPLHDGAVLIVGDIIKSATCYLPLTQKSNISKELGTRHRAALGISEISDSQTIVVSEETGRVSLCVNGIINHIKDEEDLKEKLISTIYKQVDEKKVEVIDVVKGWFGYDK